MVCTVVNLGLAAVQFALAAVKALAARREPDLALKLTASVLANAGLAFLLSAPAVHDAVGAAVGSPSLPALLIYCLTLLCVGHAHLMTQLWRPERRAPHVLRRTVLAWAPVYAGTIVVMAVLYARADLLDADRPVRFAAAYGHVPEVAALHLTYVVALFLTVGVTLLQFRGLVAPDGPGTLAGDLRPCVVWFALALALDVAHVVCSVTVVLCSVSGGYRLDFLADVSWLATIASGLAVTHGMSRLTVTARREERRDHRTLQPLWGTVVRADPHLVLAPGLLWSGWDTRIALSRRLVEIRDGARSLSPWMSAAPARAVAQVARRDRGYPAEDVVAAQAAATLLYAAGARERGEPPVSAEERLAALPGADVPAAAERAHLVLVARYLRHVLVAEALMLVRRERTGDLETWARRPGPGVSARS
ncbi:MAB_1171c family putative transporter [Streptomyces sp. G45]|uniref:MAB_1171c family putative transporter n=1 Tax=Streptomyces sp. G45 TaxID=3406627 RepID=UPI003C1C9A2E